MRVSSMSTTATSYTWHPKQKKWRYTFAVVTATLAVAVCLTTRAESEVWLWLLASFFALAALLLLIEQDTHVDAAAATLVGEGRLFGRFRVWLWRHPLSKFTGVAMRRRIDPEGCDTLFVGLRQRNG